MSPREMEPELEDKRLLTGGNDGSCHVLSRVRTGCMDIDMDMGGAATPDDDNITQCCLSMAGRDCSRAMADIVRIGGDGGAGGGVVQAWVGRFVTSISLP